MEEQSCRICLKPYEAMTEIFNQLCKNSELLEKFKFLSIIVSLFIHKFLFDVVFGN